VIIGLHAIGDLKPAKNYVVIWVDRDLRVFSIAEKPDDLKTTPVSTGIYILPKLREYIESSRNPDGLGKSLEQLLEFETIYGYMLSGEWYDIGDAGDL